MRKRMRGMGALLLCIAAGGAAGGAPGDAGGAEGTKTPAGQGTRATAEVRAAEEARAAVILLVEGQPSRPWLLGLGTYPGQYNPAAIRALAGVGPRMLPPRRASRLWAGAAPV